MNRILIYGIVACVGCAAATEMQAQTVVSSPPSSTEAAGPLDYAHAKPVPGRISKTAPSLQVDPSALQQLHSSPGVAPGADAKGDLAGKFSSIQLAPPVDLTQAASSGAGASPQQFGAAGQPFSTVRVDASGNVTQSYYPFRAIGRLFFNISGSTYVCSASLIKPGVIVTAAHCVANYGKSQFYSGWQFVPAYYNGAAPYGVYTAKQAWVMTKYYNGSDSCYQYGVVCPDDVAVIVLNKNNNILPGQRTGWLGYGWNGWGFVSGKSLITQVGYPVALDGGLLQERNDSQGNVSTTFSGNTIIGSLETGGSSGGPWTNNLGVAPSLSGVSYGSAAAPNTVVGVTSWGWVDSTQKQQGASPFTSGNIVPLVNSACTGNAGYC
jgi:V8-like Glu-specific endopeptidase